MVARENGRPRAHSASSLKAIQIYGVDNKKWSPRNTRSTPELRLYMQQSMLSGLNTTVPQSLIPHDLTCRHKMKFRSGKLQAGDGNIGCGDRCRQCCRLRLALVLLQLCLGIAITTLAFYIQVFTATLDVRETPHWAGIPVSINSLQYVILYN